MLLFKGMLDTSSFPSSQTKLRHSLIQGTKQGQCPGTLGSTMSQKIFTALSNPQTASLQISPSSADSAPVHLDAQVKNYNLGLP